MYHGGAMKIYPYMFKLRNHLYNNININFVDITLHELKRKNLGLTTIEKCKGLKSNKMCMIKSKIHVVLL